MLNILRYVPLDVSFRRPIIGPKLQAWNELIRRIANLQLRSQKDVFRWNLNKSELFSVQSLHVALIGNYRVPIRNFFWEIKIPLKMKIFLWYLKRRVVLTKDNLLKRN